ncbi:hypothetical protein WBG78_23740 [Chryseolinea sp. T2]|uniref:hypothetical protein n=1 Tax=Chryseolinea sp. T2 TaxID=3129255 RepID=UPI0030770C01
MDDFKAAVRLTVALFVIDTMILLLFLFNQTPFILVLFYIFGVVSLLSAIVRLVILIVRNATGKIELDTFLKSACVIAAIIPMAMIYGYVVFTLLERRA